MQDVESILHKMEEMDLIRLNRPMGDYYSVYCPLPHGDHYESRPSCGVLLHDQYKNGQKTPAGFTHCFRGDTEVITSQGVKPVASLCDDPNVKILNGSGVWETTMFRNYGNDRLWKLSLIRDHKTKVVYTTQTHEWFVDGKPTTRVTSELRPGWYLQSLIMPSKSFRVVPEGVIHGVIYGDGTRIFHYKNYGHGSDRWVDKSNPTRVSYHINIPKFSKKAALVKYFEGNTDWAKRDRTIHGKEYYNVWSHVMPLEHNFKALPSLDRDRDYLMSFLAGYFACDGSIDLMKIHSAKADELRKVQDICVACGISTTDVSVLTHTTNYADNATLASLFLYAKSLPPEFYLVDPPKETKYSRSRWRVVSVEPTDTYEAVYCCETSTQSFVLDGNILTHNCFSCGLAKPLPDVITEILKHKNIGKLGIDWLKENIPDFDEESSEFDYLIPQDLSNLVQSKYAIEYAGAKALRPAITYVSERELASYRMTVPYMYQRGLTDELIEKYDIGYDANFIPPGRKKPMPCVTFPVKDENGNTLFLCRRSIQGKFFHYPQGVEKSVYGLYELPDNVSSVVVCESCFNALTATKYGYPAVALLGTGTAYEISQLKKLGVREFVLCLDGDEAGQKGIAKLKKALGSVAIVWAVKMPVDKDVNDCTKEEFDALYATRE